MQIHPVSLGVPVGGGDLCARRLGSPHSSHTQSPRRQAKGHREASSNGPSTEVTGSTAPLRALVLLWLQMDVFYNLMTLPGVLFGDWAPSVFLFGEQQPRDHAESSVHWVAVKQLCTGEESWTLLSERFNHVYPRSK